MRAILIITVLLASGCATLKDYCCEPVNYTQCHLIKDNRGCPPNYIQKRYWKNRDVIYQDLDMIDERLIDESENN